MKLISLFVTILLLAVVTQAYPENPVRLNETFDDGGAS